MHERLRQHSTLWGCCHDPCRHHPPRCQCESCLGTQSKGWCGCHSSQEGSLRNLCLRNPCCRKTSLHSFARAQYAQDRRSFCRYIFKQKLELSTKRKPRQRSCEVRSSSLVRLHIRWLDPFSFVPCLRSGSHRRHRPSPWTNHWLRQSLCYQPLLLRHSPGVLTLFWIVFRLPHLLPLYPSLPLLQKSCPWSNRSHHLAQRALRDSAWPLSLWRLLTEEGFPYRLSLTSKAVHLAELNLLFIFWLNHSL